jgi:hypothetical protein
MESSKVIIIRQTGVKWPRYYNNEDQLRPNLPDRICQAEPVLQYIIILP